MSSTNSRAPTRARGQSVSVGGSGTTTSNFATRNPYEALQTIVEGPTSSPTSFNRSASQNVQSGGRTALMSSPHGPIPGASPSTPHGTNVTPQHAHRTSAAQGTLLSPFTSPSRGMPTTPVRGSGSPQQMSTPRQVGAKIQSPRTPQGLAMGGSRAMLARQGSPLQAPPMSHCPVASSLKGIPEVLTVQELAFRQGQLDHGVTCAQAPRSPFAEYYDYLWLEYYVLGKEVGGTPVSAPNTEQTSTIENFPWPILINPYTQGLQRPNGAVDADWVRKVCILALDCMAALVASVCRRQREWKTMVCDVPSPIRQAIKHFDDLEMRYQGLQKAAKEALAGGLPAGY